MPVGIKKAHAPDHEPEQGSSKPAANKWSQPPPVHRIRIHRCHQHQSPQPRSSILAQAFRSRHHRDRASMRRPQQIKRRNSQLCDKPQKTLRRPPHGMIQPRRTIRKPRTHHVRRINRSVRRQRRHRISPRKRIPQQPMQQNQRRPRARAQVTHAHAIQLHPAFFHARAQRRANGCSARGKNFAVCRHHIQIFSLQIFQPRQLFCRRMILFKRTSPLFASLGEPSAPRFLVLSS